MSPPGGFRPADPVLAGLSRPGFSPSGFAADFTAGQRATRAQAPTARPDSAQPNPAQPTPAPPVPAGLAEPSSRPGGPWPELCDQFGLQLLVLAEQLRTSLDELEADEADPERLQRLYQVDHAVTRMRRACRDLRTLAGRAEEDLAGFTTSLLDVIRMALSGIERYTQVSVGQVTDLAVLGYAADDIGELMGALLDNATRYSPGAVSVSGHLLDDGSVLLRVEDNGIGIAADQAAALNDALAGPVPEVDERTGRHTGFPVVHRIARKHAVGVQLAARPQPATGTIALVTIPPQLLCEVPPEQTPRRPAAVPGPSATRPTTVNDVSQLPQPRPHQSGPDQYPRLATARAVSLPEPPPAGEQATGEPYGLPAGLPRRPRTGPPGGAEPRARSRDQARSAPERQQAARWAFADDLSAFSQGAQGAQGARDRGRADDDIVFEEESTP